MDSALQSTIGFMLSNGALLDGRKALLKPYLPFALESLDIFSPCTSQMYAWVRHSDSYVPSDKVQKFDIDICNKQGNVCVRMKGFSSKVLEGELRDPKVNDSIGVLLATPVWKEMAVQTSATQQEYAERLLLLCEMPEVMAKKLQSLILRSHCENLKSEQDKIESCFTEYAIRCFEIIRKILEKKPQGMILIQILVHNTQEQSLFAGLSGLLKTATLENPKIVGQLIEINTEETLEGLLAIVNENSWRPQDSHIRYQEHKRLVATWKEEAGLKPAQRLPWKDQGVYIITGGMGGLGILFCREILRQTKDAKIILTGRSAVSPQRQSILDELKALGGEVDYQKVDVANLNEVNLLVESIQCKYKKLDGILHCAGEISDNFILKKRADEFRKVLLPKVTGTINLDEATRGTELDFFVLFSSCTAAIGNIGQADYATANAFMDQFAVYRNRLVDLNERNGQTISINWPLWKEGGMGIDTTSETMMKQLTGMVAMQTETGIQAFYQSLNSNQSQSMVMEGNLRQMRSLLFETNGVLEEQVDEKTIIPCVDPKTLEEKTELYLKKQFSSLFKLPISKIDAQTPFEKYGIDSILAMNLTNQLEKTFGPLSKTLFFEYQTIAELTCYFIKSYEEKFASLFQEDAGFLKETKPMASSANAFALKTKQKRRRRFSNLQTPGALANASGPLDIAIIGLSGRYPESANMLAYWKNLRDGKDCIIEVPDDRWNWREYFSEDYGKRGSHYSKWGGFIDGVDEFDPLFFNISPREADMTDPQERLFLEHAWMAMEDAGYTRERLQIGKDSELKGQVGVYVGVMFGEYQLLGAEESLRGNRIGFAGSLSSIANRVSYIFNLHGPSMTVDTMCSSSLTSIHLACQDLRQGRTNLALAGGVNISIHPNKYLMLSTGQFISTKGHCESFGEGGDGYIPGEGVGVVLLKRLDEAIKDGDHIYGIIQGSAINHGGKTNGYTVPNPNAQRNAIERVLSESGIDPRHISYIEAHGTGTKLGDPIEIAALSQAFGKYTQEKGFCRIGSTKSNIGHCEGAAGVAGLTKVLLQMKYGQIAPSLHSSTLNPNIDFKNTPFVVNQELMNWDCPIIDVKELPKIAGISSFGAGGSNAHLIIKEYQDSQRKNKVAISASSFPVIVPFSARTKEQLLESARNMLHFLKEHAFVQDSKNPIYKESTQLEQENQNVPSGTSSLDLINLSFTLQVGREAMEERLGFIVSSIKELEEKLEAYLSGDQEIEKCYQGQVKRNKETLGVFTANEELQEAIEKWIQRRKLSSLLDLWVKGLVLDWNKLYGETKPEKISLPTYPFAKERYWISETQGKGFIATAGSYIHRIHPLLHENNSDLLEQRFTSTFTGKEFFLNDHKIKGEKVLPGVCYLEMVRAAVEKASGRINEGMSVLFKNIVWAQPIVVIGSTQKVHIGMFGEDDGQIRYEVYTESKNGEELIVHFQGAAEFKKKKEPTTLDIQKLHFQMNHGALSAEDCYQAFKEMGIDYGEGHQGVREIYLGENQLLAKLNLPSSVKETQNEYVLHPSLMDATLQSTIGLMLKSDAFAHGSKVQLKPSLPFALESLEIFAPCTFEMHAWVRFTGACTLSGEIKKLDIDICDEQGNVCVKMRGFSSRVLEGEIETPKENDSIGTLLETPVLKKTDVQISTTLLSQPALKKKSPLPQAELCSSIDTESLLSKVQSILIQSVSKTLKLNQQDIDLEGKLDEYGFDSITLTDLTNQLNQKYNLVLAPTVFFEHLTIGSLANYLISEHESVFAEQFRMETKAPSLSEVLGDKEKPSFTLKGRRPRFVTTKDIVGKAQEIEPIAIVGMSGCFPEAENLDQFWQNLVEGKDCISQIPKERWDWKTLYGDPHQEVNKCSIKWGGFINNLFEFDPLFFGISPREAELMDPQQRLLMTYVYLAIEDAGYSVKTLSGSNTGIFVGTGSSGYSGIIEKAGTAIEGYTSTGMIPSVGPNRMSYFLDFHGPSEPIETACSSSLVAIHRALQAMECGSCDAAIVGGVNAILTPEAHISFNKAGMLCEDGRCKTFSTQANGYVRGEGVGMLFLKRLSHAETDSDHIYGLIRASAENHGGKANSLTAPNPKAQTELLKAVYKKSGLDPRTISYIEAHGTGTELGDPIEIKGLKTAFNELYHEFGYDAARESHCGIGSVKSNIGHLELAAGVAGVIKVLLQFKHKKLVSTLHCKEVNPYIDLRNTPFYILQESKDWNCLKDESGFEIPRRAGVSSFGFGGVNAHVVLEEYCAKRSESNAIIEIQTKDTFIVPLSARTKEQLEQRARDLFEFLHVSSLIDLQSLAYTLQVGRDAMEERLGFVVTSMKELEEKLAAYISGNQEIDDLYQGEVKRNKETLAVFTADEDLQKAIESWINKGKYSKILGLWVKGLVLDWNRLYGETKPKRISLPTYPFAKELYRISETHGNGIIPRAGFSVSVIHPLLHENSSDLSEQRFSSTFTGKEFFLNDHKVNGEKVLPAVCYLEMARAAVEKASGEINEGMTIYLKNIVWAQPIFVNGFCQRVHIGLYGENDGQIQYEVYTESENQEEIVHSNGVAELKKIEDAHHLDIQNLLTQMNKGTLKADICYKAFKNMGIVYGDGHRGIREIYQGENQLIAKLYLPSSVHDTRDEYVLHPSLMDAALQSSIGFLLKNGDLSHCCETLLKASIPFALESLQILAPCTFEMYAWVRYSVGCTPSDKVQKLDIDICDEQGNLCVEMLGFSFSVLVEEPRSQQKIELDKTQTENLVTEYKKRTFYHDLPLLRDHSVSGTPLLMGAAYLSMMIEVGNEILNGKSFSIEKVLYASPLSLDVAETAEVFLQGKSFDNKIYFSAVYSKNNENQQTEAAEGVLDLVSTSLTGKDLFVNYVNNSTLIRNGSLFYSQPKQKFYGSCLYSVQKVYNINESKVVGKIQLTETMIKELPDYVIHPSVIDACHVISTFSLTTEIDLLVENHAMPIMIEKVVVKGDSSKFQNSEYFCIAEKKLNNNKIAKIDLQLFSMDGELLCLMEGFTTKKIIQNLVEQRSIINEANDSIGTLLVTPVWKETEILPGTFQQEYGEHKVMLCEMPAVKANELQSLIPGSHCENLKSEKDQIELRFTKYAIRCFEIIRKTLEKKPQVRVLFQIFVPNTLEQSLFAGLSALLKTVNLENSKMIGQLIECNPEEACESILGIAKENSRCPQDSHIRYKEHKRLLAYWNNVGEGLKPAQLSPWKYNGVYLITGGLGALGILFAREILRETKDSKIILTGRSVLSPQMQSVLDKLKVLRGDVDYQTVDVSNLE